MRQSFLAALVVVALGGATAHAQTTPPANRLYGSDTLFNILQELTGSGPNGFNINPLDLGYVGGGTTTGENAVVGNNQEIAPMSRALNASACNGAPATAGCYAIGRDLMATVGNDPVACDALNWGTSITVTEQNGVPELQCPGCTGNQFPLDDWRTVLRVIFAGRHTAGSSAPKECNSDVRRTLVNSWGLLFKDGCAGTTCTQLRHAYRRDDFSGTTDTFLSLLQLPGVSSTPFCNGDEQSDVDPIRRPCVGNGFQGNGDEVCGPGGTLGLVLPVVTPQQNAYPPVRQACSAAPFGGNASGTVAWTLADRTKYGANCPNGAPTVGGTCWWPKRSGSVAGQGFDCIAAAAHRPVGSPSTLDARIYNLWRRNSDGTVVTYQRPSTTGAIQNRPMNHAHYLTRGWDCRFLDSTDQIGCFAKDDPCSIGYAGVGALETNPTGVKGLQLRSTTAPFENLSPVIENFARYGLARYLWVCTRDEFANTGTQPANFVAAQQTLWNAIKDSDAKVTGAVVDSGFFAVEDPSNLRFQSCF